MAEILKFIHKFEKCFDKCTERFIFYHPFLAFIAMFIGMPIFVLAAVTVCTVAIILPIALIFGWI